MTTNSVSKEQVEAMMDPKWVQTLAGRIVVDVCEIERDSPEDDPMACIVYAPELDAIVERRVTEAVDALRTSSGGVTSGEVVTDEMVERACAVGWYGAVSWDARAALGSNRE